ncbi:MAG TPA: HAMP domain-containing sensor histidine kinase, partial [Phycisphaerae bacterium]
TDGQRDHLSTITEATRELTEMVDDFLDSSKLRSRALSIYRQRHTVHELFDFVEPMITVRAQPKRIKLERLIPQGIPPFFCDLSKAARVLTNLAVNAIKATPEGLPLQLWSQTTPDGDTTIGITDQGPGLRPEDLRIIFERFKQLEEPQLAGTKGFGLGLSIVKQLTWLNLGSIQIQSERGKGSTFSFTLPACDLTRIVSCFLENIQSLDEVGDIWMLRIRSPGHAPDVSMLRRVISTFCYPMDIVLEGPDAATVNVLGVSRNPEAWSARIRKEIARFHRSITENDAPELDIQIAGPWLRDADRLKLHPALIVALNGELAHAS